MNRPSEIQARIERSHRDLARLDSKGARYANARTVFFAGAVAFALLSYTQKINGIWGLVGAGVCAAVFLVLVSRHAAVVGAEERERVRLSLRERSLARMTGAWKQFADRGESFLADSHLYSADLNVFGQGSLFQLVNETATVQGEERLAQMLSSAAPVQVVSERQTAIAELSASVDFRENLIAEARVCSKERVSARPFLAWAEGGPHLSRAKKLRPLAWILPPLTVCLYLAGPVLGSRIPFVLSLLAQLALAAWTHRELAENYSRLSAGERGLFRYGPVFRVFQNSCFNSGLLQGLSLRSEALAAPRRMARLSFLYSFVELRQSALLHTPIHLLTLWDIHWMGAVETWRARYGRDVRRWFEALAEWEALSSLAGYSYAKPHFVFPKMEEGPPQFRAKELGHPLLDEPVLKDVELVGPGRLWIVTGSNMSGKTTLLRTVGLNSVIAQAGGPVCAGELTLSPLAVACSMRVTDSLERGVSYFYAEAQRLKALLDAAKDAHGRALVLLDEVLLGTNTQERQIASWQILEMLLGPGALVLVTTHDLSLTQLAQKHPDRVVNVHFDDQLLNGQMTFDYKLRSGVVSGTNALAVLRQAGIPLP